MKKNFLMENFDDIRCYNDDEYLSVATMLVKEPILLHGIQKYHPDMTIDQIKDLLLSFRSLDEFQFNIVKKSLERVIKTTMTEFSVDGFFNLNPNLSYIFMSNHRDIVLDSGLINYQLIKQSGFVGCEIAIGSNLLKNPIVKALVRLNKSFMVKRNLPMQEMIEASKQLSNYIQHVLKVKKKSVWIAQREGRAKDGNDTTNPGLLKMLCFSAQGSIIEHLKELNIIPVTISYEYNPCDGIMLPDLVAKAKGIAYQKQPGEDNIHMATGIDGFKGNVHIYFGQPINEKLNKIGEAKNKNELLKLVAEIIDKEIQINYKLWKSNFIAFDLLEGISLYANEYSPEEKQTFIEYVEKQIRKVQLENEPLAKPLFYEMYANPVRNKIKQLT